MITPEELRERAQQLDFAKDMEKALIETNNQIERALDNGDIRMLINGHVKLGNVFYYKEKQELIAQELIKRGFKCKEESVTVGGVLQHPSWYVYFL